MGLPSQSTILGRVRHTLEQYGEGSLARQLEMSFGLSGGSGWAERNGLVSAVQSYQPTLPAAVYSCGVDQSGNPLLIKESMISDELILLPNSKSTYIIDEFRKFWELSDQFETNGFIHKRGFFLIGPAGSGKTSIIQLLCKELIKDDGIVLFLESPTVAYSCLRMIRSVEPNRKLICILEDLDSLIKNYEEADFLSLFDGEKSIDHVVFLATTNYPEDIDKRFLDRPSRFDQVITVELPELEDRLYFFEQRTKGLDTSTLQDWAEKTKGFGIAHLKEVIISVQCFGYGFAQTIERLKSQKKTMTSEKMHKTKVGFGEVDK
jgi:energy-coupling factor transporter ATP-binding protein EcfA2